MSPSDDLSDPPPPPGAARPAPGSRAAHEARLAKALRDNLRRRKTAARPPAPSED